MSSPAISKDSFALISLNVNEATSPPPVAFALLTRYGKALETTANVSSFKYMGTDVCTPDVQLLKSSNPRIASACPWDKIRASIS